jgi:hypothetical protein
MATKDVVKWLAKIERQINRLPVKAQPVRGKAQQKRVQKGHAGINGQHDDLCLGPILGRHCVEIIKKGPRAGKPCGYCIPIYKGVDDWTHVFSDGVCRKHFDIRMEKRKRELKAKRRGW